VFTLFLDAAGQVALVALLLGAGLPALFAVGVRSFTLAGTAGRPGADGETITRSSVPVPVLRAIGTLCYVLVIVAVVIGLSVIIATGFGQELSFDGLVPTFVPKS
jgi:hypothetical protein